MTVYETTEEGWAWGQLEADGYVGLHSDRRASRSRLQADPQGRRLRTLVFPGPNIKLPPVASLALGCHLAVARSEPPFAVTASGGYVPAGHLVPLDSNETDFVAVAERFLGAPYLWGGKTNLGLDCSGLVQIALAACGVPCPRDSDMQEHALGRLIAPSSDMSMLRRGDLLFWKGHVAIVRDQATLIHANAHHMAVAPSRSRKRSRASARPAASRPACGGSNSPHGSVRPTHTCRAVRYRIAPPILY